MSVPLIRRPSGTASRVPWLPLALLASGVLALAGSLSQRSALSFAAVVLLLIVWAPRVWRRHNAAMYAVWLAAAALLLVPAMLGLPELAWTALPVVCFAMAAWWFARTLRPGEEPLVTRCVRVIEGEARLALPGVAAYTRGVTWFWAVLLGAMAVLSIAIALLAQPGGWLATFGVHPRMELPGSLLAWYPEAGCWIVLAGAFAAEYLFRRWHLRHVPQLPLWQFVVQIVQCWPTILRGEDSAA